MKIRPSETSPAAACLGCLLAALLCLGCGERGTDEKASAPLPARKAAGSPAPAAPPLGGASLADVAERCIKGVVNISSTKVIRGRGAFPSPFFGDPFFEHFFGPRFDRGNPRERREKSLGSGVIVDAAGVILTNNHVVEDAEEISVTLADERTFQAEVVGADPKSDLAVIRLREKPKSLEPIPFGDSGALRLGDLVLAIGNPFGLSHTVTMGIVSAKGRANVGIADYEDFIQTDAAINPGNSGGALVDLRGELVGINTAIFSRSGGNQGIGFAIPSQMAKAVMESILKHGKVVRGWLGVTVQDVDRHLADSLKLPSESGVLVSDVTENSPADTAGLARGDVITHVDGDELTSPDRLRNLIASRGAGAEVELTVFRDGRRRTVRVKLRELPEQLGRFGALESKQGLLGGLTVAPLSPLARERFDIPAEIRHGVVVTEVEQGSPAQEAGLVPGAVILEVNRRAVDSVRTFASLYDAARGNLLVLVYREGSTVFLVLRK